jgi:nucleoside-diphosphate-sugar epimerase
VKRAVDRRPYVVLANRGLGHFHTVAGENVGELVRLVAASARTDVFNCGDPDPPRVFEIARGIAETAGHPFTEILLAANAARGELGQTPWSTPKPLLVDMAKAEDELGYRPAITWADAIPRQVQWLLDATHRRDWREVLPRGADYLRFEYEEEDALVAALAKA